MFDVQVIDYGVRCIAMCNNDLYEGQSSNLDLFYREEMVTVLNETGPCTVEILPRDGTLPVLQLKTKFLALTPNFFGKGYALFKDKQKILDLDISNYLKMVGVVDESELQ